MSGKYRILVLVIALGVAHAGGAADSLRCGNRLVLEGAAVEELERTCGRPDSVESIREPIMATRPNGSTYRVGTTSIERWTYDRGPRRLVAVVTMEDGVVQSIEFPGRGERRRR